MDLQEEERIYLRYTKKVIKDLSERKFRVELEIKYLKKELRKALRLNK